MEKCRFVFLGPAVNWCINTAEGHLVLAVREKEKRVSVAGVRHSCEEVAVSIFNAIKENKNRYKCFIFSFKGKIYIKSSRISK